MRSKKLNDVVVQELGGGACRRCDNNCGFRCTNRECCHQGSAGMVGAGEYRMLSRQERNGLLTGHDVGEVAECAAKLCHRRGAIGR